MQTIEEFNLDELIPAEFRSVLKEEEEKEEEEVKEEPNEVEELIQGHDIEDSPSTEDKPSLSSQPDIDLDSIDIDKVINGEDEIEAEVEEDKESKSPKHSWHNEDAYKAFAEKFAHYGEDTTALDELIQSVSDKKVLDNSKYTNDLKGRLEEVEKTRELDKVELERLKSIERLAYFDSAKETQDKYIAPIKGALKNIKDTLDFQGVSLSTEELIQAKDRLSFNNALASHDIDDDAKVKLYNNWKSYNELSNVYTEKRKEASLDLGNYLNTTVPDDLRGLIMNNSLSEFVNSNDKYSYIKQGLDKGVEDNEEVKKVIAQGRENFVNMLEILKDPTTHVRDREFLGKLATFMWDNAHKTNIANKYYDLKKTTETRDNDYKKLIKAYKELAKSAGGISGVSGGVNSSTPTSEKEEMDTATKEYSDFLSGKIPVEKLLE